MYWTYRQLVTHIKPYILSISYPPPEPCRIRFIVLRPGEDFNFDFRLNRIGVVIVVRGGGFCCCAGGRSLDEEALRATVTPDRT